MLNKLSKKKLINALERSVNLQSHYAHLLNMYDGGERLQFVDGEAWVARLDYVDKAIPKKSRKG